MIGSFFDKYYVDELVGHTPLLELRNIEKKYALKARLIAKLEYLNPAGSAKDRVARQIKGAFIPGQFDNPSNSKAHYLTTGPEIWEDTDGKADALVAGIGTGGTITGTGRFLKEKNPSLKVFAVEPASSPVLSKGYSGRHGIQGIGAGFVPAVLDTSVFDEILTVTDQEAYEYGRLMGIQEGILVGISSGAALKAAIEVAKREEMNGKTIVVILPDTGDRYLSTPMFDN